METINYEEQFNEAMKVIKEMMIDYRRVEKKNRELERALRVASMDILSTDEFEIKVWKSKGSNFVDRGSFEHNLLGEDNGGGLWFDPEGRLVDYDGVYQLPAKVIDVLLSEDFIVQEH